MVTQRIEIIADFFFLHFVLLIIFAFEEKNRWFERR